MNTTLYEVFVSADCEGKTSRRAAVFFSESSALRLAKETGGRVEQFSVQDDGNYWVKEHPKPRTQGWYWWRPYPGGIEKVLEVYRTERRRGVESWVLVHPYAEMEISNVMEKWPLCEWSNIPIGSSPTK